jgi:hypothetical protein
VKKYLKWIAIAVAVIIALPFLIAAVLPRTFVLEKEVVIARPKNEVFDFVRHMENQKQYMVWARIDPATKISVQGNDGTVGAVYTWESIDQNVGRGEQEIIAIQDGERIDFQIRMLAPFQSTDPVSTFVQSVGDNETKVRSIYRGTMGYPLNLLCSVVCTKVGDDMQKSLVTLKEVLEHPKSEPPQQGTSAPE